MIVFNRLSTVFRAVAAGVAVGIAGSLAVPAAAQLDGAAALAEIRFHDYAHRDMQLFSQGLHLDDYQRLILDSLYQDYLDRFEKGWAETEEKIHALRDNLRHLDGRTDQAKILEAVFAPFEEWRTDKQRLKQRFENDVQAILNPEQMEQWPQFQRQMTREKTMHLGRLSGESLNLFHVVRDLRMDDRAYMNLEPVLDQYSQELHQALVTRNQIIERGQTEFIRGLRTTGAVPPPRNVGEEIGTRVRIRDVNLRYVEVIAAAVPEQFGDRFRTIAQEAAFPRIYRQLPAERLISRALEIEDLDDDTREAIQSIHETYLDEMNRLNSQIHHATVDFEPKQLRNQADMAAARHTGETVDRIADPTRSSYVERDERAQYYAQLVQSLLTPEQAASLPSAQRLSGRELRERGGTRGRGEARPVNVDPRGGRPTVPGRSGGERGR